MAVALASQQQYGDTEISCGRITLRRDEMNLTLHCIFCELAYEKLDLIRNHILRVHTAEIFDTPTLPITKYSINRGETIITAYEPNEVDEPTSLEISILDYDENDTDEEDIRKKLVEELELFKKDLSEHVESPERWETSKNHEDDVNMKQNEASLLDDARVEIESDAEVEEVKEANEENLKEGNNSKLVASDEEESIVLDVVVERNESTTEMDIDAETDDESFSNSEDEVAAEELMSELQHFENTITVHKIFKDSDMLVQPTMKKLKLKLIPKSKEDKEEKESPKVDVKVNKVVKTIANIEESTKVAAEQNETEELDDLLSALEETVTISSSGDEVEISKKTPVYTDHISPPQPNQPSVELPLDDAQTLQLIELWKADERLWHKDHLCDPKTRTGAIECITAKLNAGVDADKHVQDRTVRAKIHKLKLLYRCYESLGERNSDESLYDALSFLRGHQQPKPWRCDICTELVNGVDAQTHNAKHKSDKTGGKCVMCKLELPSQCYVVPHMTTHRIYICELCNRDDFRTVLSYRTHYEEMHPQLPVPLHTNKPVQMEKCKYCVVEFSTQRKYQEHLIEYHRKHPYPCSFCEMDFSTALQLALHFNALHNEPLRRKRQEQEAAAALKRKMSELKRIEIQMKKHAQKVGKKQEKSTEQKEQENQEENAEQKAIENKGTEPQEYECEFCYHAPFSNAKEWEQHRVTVHWDIPNFIATNRWHAGPFKCPHCSVILKTAAERIAHVERHYTRFYDLSDSCVCEFCGKRFDMPNRLRRHRKEMHLEVGWYKCKLCNAAYNSSQRLKLHVNSTHTKRPKYLCTVCTSGFYAKRYLNQHTWHVHKIAPPFKCDQCEKQMFSMKALNAHKRKRHKSDGTASMNETASMDEGASMDETKDEL